ncbi:MAG TPA: GlsB/YeaQ/YmgE family stress response membrane protein [Steroidobacteraceae bacterium]|nr:GlsB/YeaQ/YmgE family stress response membrane protein [Steroidobacteraceae bacterium]
MITIWLIALGLAGFVAGFFGPIALNPDANQGPLLGIFLTGPGGAVAGLLLGTLCRTMSVSPRAQLKALTGACIVLAVGTLFYCLPAPEVIGHVIDAQPESCNAATEELDAAIADWQKQVNRVTWANPAPDWKSTAQRAVEADQAVVVTLHVYRQATVYEHRKPWNRGRKSVSAWQTMEATQRFYVRGPEHSCASLLASERSQYLPFSHVTYRSPSSTWPPADPAAFLSLTELGPVPQEVARLIRSGT